MFDGINSYSLFNNNLTEGSEDVLVSDLINNLNQKKYKGYKIYLHNFAKFDSASAYFVLKPLANLGFCSALLHNGKLLSLTFKSVEMKHPITFKDSYLLLPSSLKKLCDSFKVENPKARRVATLYYQIVLACASAQVCKRLNYI
jgi:hypothetical protein